MDLFFLKALFRGQLATTPNFEKTLNQVAINAKRYREVEKSAFLAEYKELEKKVTAPDFIAKKEELIKTKYEHTPEYKAMAEFKKLCKDKYVRTYLRNGKEEERMSVQRYLELKAEVETADFQKRNDFWKDKNRWTTTDEYKLEERYNELKNDSDIVFFFNADKKNVERWEQFDLAFNDDFEWVNLRNSPWKPGFIYPNDKFLSAHSYGNEQQAYCDGKMVDTNNSVLTIFTKKEACEGRAWDAKKGMYMKTFPYSSDALYTDAVAIEEGSVVQVKCKCSGKLNHGVYLRSRNHLPYISIFDSTSKNIMCGVKTDIKTEDFRKITATSMLAYTIFTLSWQKDEIVWFVNNLEVCRMKNNLPKGEKLYLHLYSFQFEKASISEGELNVDWIRVYNVKKK